MHLLDTKNLSERQISEIFDLADQLKSNKRTDILRGTIPIINAMTSDHHPCEILSDLYSIARLRGDYRDLVYTFVGTESNISNSWMEIAKVMIAKVG